ncbi:hypothetical protein [Kutzneria kofuensis]|uniref:Uncharacterized protein n=1 Tax=Kutzneria kofuensis TaxID=103725 RepID=A0A7W9KR48_9PSEU|nr:hypothetical protein [Kutzneria kofuensis]MBB5897102.1 hypothetical protein [Kutzneria kofuensis]
MSVHEIPAAIPDAVGRRLDELETLARAEQAMADGRPTADQELLLMSVGSVAHLARRHRSIAVPSRDGRRKRWFRR